VLPALPLLPAAAVALAAACETVVATFLRACFIDGQLSSFELLLIQRVARGAPLIVVVHLDEAETARASSLVVADETNRRHLPEGGEQLFELRLLGAIRQISDKDSHWHNPLKGWRRKLDDFWSVQQRE